jgi:membrane-associated protease RseP (regulator of RpoE activity)
VSASPPITSVPPPPSSQWRTSVALFLCTVLSVFSTYAVNYAGAHVEKGASFGAVLMRALSADSLSQGAQFAGALLLILVAHESGHYIAARIHKVEASPPYFIPLPYVSPFGTMGAVIRMRGAIATRRALLDIGASGPLAGLVVAIPLYLWGVAHSRPTLVAGDDLVSLGESILIKLMDRAAAPATPPGMELVYSPVAFAGWAGMFVTMINLLPVGQLDGGHVAYALFGKKQDTYARLVHRALLVFFFVVLAGHLARDFSAGVGVSLLGRRLGSAVIWVFWFQLLAILGTIGARNRDVPAATATDDAPSLSIRTRLVAALGLAILASLARSQTSWTAAVFVVCFFAGLGLLFTMEWKWGTLRPHDLFEHPEAGNEPLGAVRSAIAVFTLVVFVLLFMPEPFSI